MAQLLKHGARKPRIELGYAFTGNNYSSTEPHEPGAMPGMCYDLTVQARGVNSAGEYTARLTEDEMLSTMEEWLKAFNSHRAQKRRDAAKKAALAAGEHLNMRDRGRS